MLSVQQVINHLPGVSIEYKNADGIAMDLLPSVFVELRAGTYTKFDKDTPFRIFKGDMARTAQIPEMGEDEDLGEFACKDWGLADALPFDLQSLTPTKVDRVSRKVRVLTQAWQRSLESKTVALVNGFPQTAVTASWQLDTSNPIQDLKNLRRTLLMAPNVAVIARPVWDRLQYHPKVLAIRSTFRPGSISKADMAEILEVDKILVPDIKANTANKLQTSNEQYLWGNTVFMCYRNPENEMSEEEVSWAGIFTLENFGEQLPGGPRTASQIYSSSERGTLVRLWEEPKRGAAGALMVALSKCVQLNVIGPDLGGGLTGTMV
jgi:hypothetical protein